MRVLVVEDEPEVRDHIVRVLDAAGYITECEGDGEEAWFLGDTEDYSAVILDLGLPGLDGISILSRWRENKRDMPVIVLTARANWRERVAGINAGADDYLGKPFHPEELVARLHSVLRRSNGQARERLVAANLELDVQGKIVAVDEIPIALSSLEYRVLEYLMYNKGNIVTSSELYEQVYGSGYPASNTLEALVARLRRKLGTPIISTRRGVGYIVEDQ